MTKVKVRYGPSPTGIPHVGNIRTALFNYLFAKNQNGEFLLRIEDTDQNRIVKGAVEKIQESLKLLNLNWNGEIIFQSKRLSLYKEHLDILKKKGLAYEDEGAWRFKIQTSTEKESWKDLVHQNVEFPTNVLEDFIIIKSDGYPTYHFASVVDDHLMEISHVFRGDEWISSTPKHLQLYKAFGWEPPQFVHLPIILGPDKKKLSKRDGAKSVMEFLEEGYLKEALVNFLALLGWAPKTNQELFSLEELSREFSLDRINKNSPIFNLDKLDWFNGQWIRKLSIKELTSTDYFKNKKISALGEFLPLVKDRMNNLSDFDLLTAGFFKEPEISKLPKLLVESEVINELVKQLEKISSWEKETINNTVGDFMEKSSTKKADLYRSVGIATLGATVTPPLIDSLEKLGKEKTIERLKNATKK